MDGGDAQDARTLSTELMTTDSYKGECNYLCLI